MHHVEGSDEFAWIGQSVKLASAQDPDSMGSLVSHCLPAGFGGYAKLLHPIYEDLSVHDKNLTWHDTEEARLDRLRPTLPAETQQTLDIIRSAGGVTRQASPLGQFPARRVLWHELAKQLGVEVRPTITDGSLVPHLKSWPRYLVPPAEGSLEQKQLERLTTVLAPVTGDQDCLFYWTTIFREEPLWRGKLAELPESPRRQAEGRSPNYVWPSSHDWCICTDYDLCFTLIGGSRSLIDTLLSDSVLECLEVDLSTRIDYRADG